MGFLELFEIGFFTAFFNWSNPVLTAVIYLFVLLGFLIQYVLQKKCHKSEIRWMLIGGCGIGIIISECAWQVITGWDRILVEICYGVIVCMLLGAIISMTICFFKNKKSM